MLNNVVLMGRLTASPIPRGTEDRLAASFSVAVQRDYKDKDGNRGCDFIECVAFGKLGEHVLGYYDKGQMIALRGRLESGTYTRSDGISVKTWHVVVSDCWFCGAPPAGSPSTGSPSTGSPSTGSPPAGSPPAGSPPAGVDGDAYNQSLDDTYPF